MRQSGQIVTFPFPQTDLAAGKLRPALLITKTPGPFEDWLLCMISTEVRQAVAGFDEIVAVTDSDFERTGLRTLSVIRVSRLAVVSSHLLVGAIGMIAPDRLNQIRSRLSDWFKPQT